MLNSALKMLLTFSGAIVSILSSLALLRLFGVSATSDAYALFIAIVTVYRFFQLMFFEQFIFFYNNIRTNSKENAEDFFLNVLGLVTIISLLSYIVASFLVLFMLQNILTKFFSIESKFINIICWLAVIFFFRYLIVILTSLLTSVLASIKRSHEIIVSNMVFMTTFVLGFLLFRNYYGVYAIGLSAFLAQILSFVTIFFAKEVLKIRTRAFSLSSI